MNNNMYSNFNERHKPCSKKTVTFVISMFVDVKLGIIYEIQGPSWIKEIMTSPTNFNLLQSYHNRFVISYKDDNHREYEVINYRNIINNLHIRDKLFFTLMNTLCMKVDVVYFPDISKEKNLMYEKWIVTSNFPKTNL